LHEIQAIAKEVGLDPALIEKAAAVVPAAPLSAAARFFGGPQKYQMEYTASGQLSEAGVARVVDAIRQATGHHGTVKEALGSLEWQTVGELSMINVTVSPRAGEASVRVLADRGPAGGVTLIVPLVLGAMGVGITGAIVEPTSIAGIVGVVAGPLTAAFAVGRTMWATSTKGFQKKLRKLMGAASRAVDENVEAPALSGEPKEPLE
jgi:hypothetical protein